jgi:hypothetical protein
MMTRTTTAAITRNTMTVPALGPVGFTLGDGVAGDGPDGAGPDPLSRTDRPRCRRGDVATASRG